MEIEGQHTSLIDQHDGAMKHQVYEEAAIRAPADTPAGCLLRLAAGTVVYPNGNAGLREVDFDIRRGEFVVLLGPSGAGKSTLLRSLNGLVALSAGQVLVEGVGPVDSARAWRAHRRHTAMVFQQHHLIGRLSALDNVLTGRLAFHPAWRTFLPFAEQDKRIALESLERVGLADRALQRADQLSGGQQQRVGVARALAQQPRILLADEPVASLDPATAVRVLELIHGICKSEGIAAIVSLHQVDLATRFADRIVGVGAGRIVFDGLPHELGAIDLDAIYGSPPEPDATPSPGLVREPPARAAAELALAA